MKADSDSDSESYLSEEAEWSENGEKTLEMDVDLLASLEARMGKGMNVRRLQSFIDSHCDIDIELSDMEETGVPQMDNVEFVSDIDDTDSSDNENGTEIEWNLNFGARRHWN